MPADADPIWDFLRGRTDETAADPPSGGQSADRFRRESVVRMLDATAGVLAAVRHFVEVAEDVVKEQRDRLAADPVADGPDGPDPAPTDRPRAKIPLTY
jgi:hypothetical protein